ncbi:hypothetical protein GZH47_12195 [Paenibacillus rhizovicinus]|uniref:Uncharacterized protein n=1 Tax=Paenibacillus rhizovicinus TaxID=2704463 RepID=A0A6C0NZ79_9BACL|nr:hypothetical protein [Paenibacillus rhizovicinus]QHW31528.1 hypothetical protein GZH47_12195 [Paenibacillus rhizovicinus]
MPYSTGLITNTRALGTAASTVFVNARNITNVEALIIIEVYVVSDSMPLTLAYLSGFMLAGKSGDKREFFIGGDSAYEVQLSVINPLTEVVLSTFGVDEFGNLVDGHRVLQEEMTVISLLSTTP